MKVHDSVIYCALAANGHYRGKVLAIRAPEVVDIELLKEDSGAGDIVQLRCIPVVTSLKELAPGTCCLSPSE